MALQFNEYYHRQTGLTVGVEHVLFSARSEFQQVEILETDSWGRMMVLDGLVMLSERDEFVYHEMISHVGLFTHPQPERVLVIGGGDGGTAREVLRHGTIKQVDLVEIDELVVEASREFLADIGRWENDKLNVIFEDGVEFVKDIDNVYDLIIVDGSDPVGPAEGLFDKTFLEACYRGLTENGILVAQAGTPWLSSAQKELKNLFTALDAIFSLTRVYLASIPLYPTGLWSMAFASKGPDPLSDMTMARINDRLVKFGDSLNYYNLEVHRGAFALPNFVREAIDE
ncbi:MAG: polyamine aminopropyltransferase [Balneolaceae bacterium]|nr:polyamine aminopropyltransferase [Balneolaceae bacterium]